MSAQDGEVIEINLGRRRLADIDGLRQILLEFGRSSGEALRVIAERCRPEWNVLLPGNSPDALPLSAMSAACYERPHEGPVTPVPRNAAWPDLPTPRAIPRLAERTAASGVPKRVVLPGLDPGEDEPPGDGAGVRLAVRRRHLDLAVVPCARSASTGEGVAVILRTGTCTRAGAEVSRLPFTRSPASAARVNTAHTGRAA